MAPWVIDAQSFILSDTSIWWSKPHYSLRLYLPSFISPQALALQRVLAAPPSPAAPSTFYLPGIISPIHHLPVSSCWGMFLWWPKLAHMVIIISVNLERKEPCLKELKYYGNLNIMKNCSIALWSLGRIMHIHFIDVRSVMSFFLLMQCGCHSGWML